MRVVMHAAHEEKFDSVARQMGKWVDHVLGPSFHKYSLDESWVPPINICEDEGSYCVVVALAGVDVKDIDLNAHGKRLTLSGFRETPGLAKGASNAQMHHMEIDHGRFCRTLELPEAIDTEKIEACYKSGLLWIRIPKLLKD